MATTTISLERSAYELLKANKRPGESYSQEVIRLLGGSTPRLMDFVGIIPAEDAKAIADAIEALREEDLRTVRARSAGSHRKHGRRA